MVPYLQDHTLKSRSKSKTMHASINVPKVKGQLSTGLGKYKPLMKYPLGFGVGDRGPTLSGKRCATILPGSGWSSACARRDYAHHQSTSGSASESAIIALVDVRGLIQLLYRMS